MARRFLQERRRDRYYRAAQAEGLRSRAAYKLEQLNRRYGLVRPGDRVLDLGAAPGGWSLIAQAAAGPQGRVVAVDLRGIDPIEGVDRLRGAVGDPRILERLRPLGPFDAVLSDMSPRLSGAYATDHARSLELADLGFTWAGELLAPGGGYVAKVFDGDLVAPLLERMASRFEGVHRTKPPASRAPSSELYLVGVGFRSRRVGPGEGG